MYEKKDIEDLRADINKALMIHDKTEEQLYNMFTIGLKPEDINANEIHDRVSENIKDMVEKKTLTINGAAISDRVNGYISNILDINKVGNSLLLFATTLLPNIPENNFKDDEVTELLDPLMLLVEYTVAYPTINIAIQADMDLNNLDLNRLLKSEWLFNVTHDDDVDVVDSTFISENDKSLCVTLNALLIAIKDGLAENIMIEEIK